MSDSDVITERTDDPWGSATTIGVTGHPRRWAVSGWGSVAPWRGGSEPTRGSLDWYVAAEDRWHVPASEAAVRQRRVEGTPVVETLLRVPDGDVVQRAWAVPDDGGVVVVEFENASSRAVAVALSGDALATSRAPSSVPVEGIELPGDAIVLPLGHGTSIRVALGGSGAVPTTPAMSVARGWSAVVDRASRFVLPDPAIADAVVSARCDLLLEGPVSADDDPVGFLLDVGELVRCGDDAEAWLVEMIPPVERVLAPRRRRFGRSDGDRADVTIELCDAVEATRRVALAAGDGRAVGDLERASQTLGTPPERPPAPLAALRRGAGDPDGGESVGRFVRRVERRFVSGADLLPGGVPVAWLGADFEVHRLPTGPGSSVGFALRWHGERPAVLWEQHGGPCRLTASAVDPDWSTEQPGGEALWAVPANATIARRPISFTVEGVTRDDA